MVLLLLCRRYFVRKQLGTKNSKSNEGRQENNGGVKGRDGSADELDRETGEDRQEKNGGVKGRDRSAEELDRETGEDRQETNGGVKGRDGGAEELDRETGEEQTAVGRTRRKDGG